MKKIYFKTNKISIINKDKRQILINHNLNLSIIVSKELIKNLSNGNHCIELTDEAELLVKKDNTFSTQTLSTILKFQEKE